MKLQIVCSIYYIFNYTNTCNNIYSIMISFHELVTSLHEFDRYIDKIHDTLHVFSDTIFVTNHVNNFDKEMCEMSSDKNLSLDCIIQSSDRYSLFSLYCKNFKYIITIIDDFIVVMEKIHREKTHSAKSRDYIEIKEIFDLQKMVSKYFDGFNVTVEILSTRHENKSVYCFFDNKRKRSQNYNRNNKVLASKHCSKIKRHIYT